MPKLKRGSSDTAQYKAYKTEDRHTKNTIAKLARAVKLQPNDKQAANALEKALDKGVPYKRRKSNGHKCKGLYKILGFEKNQMSDSMKKTGNGMHWYCGIEIKNATPPNHGKSMGDQLEEFGYERKKYGRKNKRTTR